MTRGKLSKPGSRRTITWSGGNPAFLRFDQFAEIRIDWAKSEFAVKPKRARLQAFRVQITELIWINRKDGNSKQLLKHFQNAAINPGRFSITECVEQVQSYFGPLAKRKSFGIPDRHLILHNQNRVVCKNRQSVFRRDTPYKDLQTSAGIGTPYLSRIAIGKTVKLSVSHRHCGAAHVKKSKACRLF